MRIDVARDGLRLKGPNVMMGSWNNPAASRYRKRIDELCCARA
jgi:hypothetical protein